MSVATINTKATGVKLTPEEELTFADIVEAGFVPAPNTSGDLSGYDPIPTGQITGVIQNATTTTTPTASTLVEVDHIYPHGKTYKAWVEQTEEEFRTQRAQIVAKYLDLDYQPLDPLFKRQFIDALRTQGDRQIRGARRMGGQVCAMGLADEVSHYNLGWVQFSGIAANAIVALNDIAEWTFAKIADWVERKL